MADSRYLELLGKMDRPVPGQSLSNDPDNPAPFERAPEYTNVHKASEYLFTQLIQEETYIPLIRALATGTPVMEMVELILFTGFNEGKFNPDLMLLLAEPLAYMLVALAEKADIDLVFYRGEDEEEDAEEEVLGLSMETEKLQNIKKSLETGVIPAGALSKEIEEKLQTLPEIPQESLLAQPEEAPQEEVNPDSLMARQQ